MLYKRNQIEEAIRLALVKQYVRRETDAVTLIDELLTAAGASMGSFMANALTEKLDDIERIDRLTSIAESRRNAGIGSQMMRWAVERCREKGCGMVQLTSNKKRIDAHRFYERLGFQRSHEGFKLYF